MNLERRTLDRISTDFSEAEIARVAGLLNDYSGPERNRVIWDILELSQGDFEKLTNYSHAAQKDYRDILYWAEYFDNDPMLKYVNPKLMVEKILQKWGRK